jgi:fatty-acyl-CoA synthase
MRPAAPRDFGPTCGRESAWVGARLVHEGMLTETYGPSLACACWPEWDRLPVEEQAAIKARPGVPPVAVAGQPVVHVGSTVLRPRGNGSVPQS